VVCAAGVDGMRVMWEVTNDVAGGTDDNDCHWMLLSAVVPCHLLCCNLLCVLGGDQVSVDGCIGCGMGTASCEAAVSGGAWLLA